LFFLARNYFIFWGFIKEGTSTKYSDVDKIEGFASSLVITHKEPD
jgi:hypothetical protein